MTSLISDLIKIFGPDRVLFEPEHLVVYSFDGTAALSGTPTVIVLPQSTPEVVALVNYARENRRALVPRGSGTCLSGGTIPSPGAITVCFTKMNRVLEVDAKNLTIRVEPGVITQTITDHAAEIGLLYPPDPGSIKISTIGGNVAENAGGLRGLKYGITRDYVMGLEVVLADGRIAQLGNKCVKDVAGYSLKDLFIGSEGTLGLITQILLKLVPQPAAKKTLLATFSRMEDAAETVSALIAEKIVPCTLEFLDNITINCIEDFAQIGLPRNAEAVLLMETDGHPVVVAEEAEKMRAVAERCGAVRVQLAETAEEAAKLAGARRSAFSALARVAPTTILEDATVPRSELAKMVRFIQDVAARHRLRIGTFGHMGDGNLHPTFLTDEKNSEEMHRVEIAMREIFDYAVALGGTITGEHGVGLAKKPFLPAALGDVQMDLLRALKRTLDPHSIFNPGKIFDLTDPKNA